jgi:hypothetical protein
VSSCDGIALVMLSLPSFVILALPVSSCDGIALVMLSLPTSFYEANLINILVEFRSS